MSGPPGAPPRTSAPTAPGPPPAAATTARRLTRDDIVRLGRTAPPWQFIPAAVATLRVAPRDLGVRFLFAAALGRLGLRTLALEQIDLLTPQAPPDPAVKDLRAALHDLAPDELPLAERLDRAHANLAALGDRAGTLRAHLGRWADHAAAFQAYRTSDANIVRRRTAETDPSTWIHLADHASAAASFITANFKAGSTPPSSLTLEGLDPPWILGAVHRALPRDANGLHPRLIAVQADPIEALDGLSLADLRDCLGQDRLLLFVGPDATPRLAEWARARLDRRLAGPYLPLVSLRTRCEPPVQTITSQVLRDQEARAAALRDAILARDADRGPAHWAARFAPWRQTSSDSPPPPPTPAAAPLRVLLPTCRYTTFLQHAAADLRDAFERLNCRAELLIEPDDSSQLSAIAYLEATKRLDPDLIVTVNYHRAQLGSVLPARQPVVCWIQDMMSHLFTTESGAAQGDLDFIAGHCAEDLFTRYAYPRDRAIGSPVVASESKFHPEPIPAHLRERFACEIACVTHHSQTVDDMHRRLQRESAADPDAAGVMDELLPICIDLARTAHDQHPWTVLREEVRRVLARRHRHADNPDIAGAFLRQYAIPIADRAFRHQAIEWAASIARRRNWRFRLYGKGWEAHPTLAPHAAGLTEHGEQLRAAYHSAVVNLHLCLTTLMHQRPMECALSGGLPILRPTRDALAALNGRAQRRIADQGLQPASIEPTTGLPLFPFEATPEGRQYQDLTTRLGMTLRLPGTVLRPQRIDAMRRRESAEPLEADPTWLFPDMPDIAFRDEASLEALVDRATTDPDWRRRTAESIAARVRERLTHTALARRILAAIADRAATLAAAPPPAP